MEDGRGCKGDCVGKVQDGHPFACGEFAHVRCGAGQGAGGEMADQFYARVLSIRLLLAEDGDTLDTLLHHQLHQGQNTCKAVLYFLTFLYMNSPLQRSGVYNLRTWKVS